MFDLEKEIRTWKRKLRKISALEDGYIEELESHLRDLVEEGTNGDSTEEAAFEQAVDKMGSINNVGVEYYKSDTRHINKRPPWQKHPFIPSLIYNYYKTAIRNIKRNKVYSTINLIGLTLSLVAFAIFALGGTIHFGADEFHENKDRIYGVIQTVESKNKEINHTAFLPAPVIDAVKNEFPEVLNGSRVLSPGRLKMQQGEKVFYEKFALSVDNNFLQIFTFNLLSGDKSRALKNPNSIILSENSAKKYFGDENPIGKQILVNDLVSLNVTAVMNNVSKLSSLRFDFLIPITAPIKDNNLLDDWKTDNCSIFLLLNQQTDRETLEDKLDFFVDKYWDKNVDPIREMYLMPLTDFRFKSDHISSLMRATNMEAIVIVMSFGLLLLIIASFNFINLSIARFMTRIKEIGMRKVIGAKKSQIVKQFLTESMIISLISFFAAAIIYELFHPALTGFMANTEMLGAVSKVSNSLFNYPHLLLFMFGAAIFTGFLSGVFPALYVSSVKPVDSLRGGTSIGKSKRRGTKILIVTQFTLSVIIIVFANLFGDQFDYWINNANFGYNRENVIIIELSSEIKNNSESLANEMLNHPAVIQTSFSQNLPGLWFSSELAKLPSMKDEEASKIRNYGVNYNFTDIFEMEIVSGRAFDPNFNDGKSIIINETTAKKFNLDNPIGQIILIDEIDYSVIGVVKDFVFNDIGFDIDPAVLYLTAKDLKYFLLKLNTPYNSELKSSIEKTWKSVLPNVPFESYDMDNYFAEMMNIGGAVITIIKFIGYLAVIFSYIGLIGLLSFLISRRTKEIGVRKVLGASVFSIIKNIVKEFFVLVVIANIIAFTLCYYLWEKIVQTGLLYMQPFDLTLAIVVVVVTTLVAIIFLFSKTYKTAAVNPVISLRTE